MCFYELACLRAREHPFPLKIASAAALALAATIAGEGTFVIAPSSAAGGGDGVADRVYQAEEERLGRKRRSWGPRSSSWSHITKPVSTAQRGTRGADGWQGFGDQPEVHEGDIHADRPTG